jgi:uncharacterized protein (DUF2062 family)
MEDTTEETYTAKDFGKDVAKSVVIGAAETAAAIAILGVIGISVQKVQNLREKRRAKKAEIEN